MGWGGPTCGLKQQARTSPKFSALGRLAYLRFSRGERAYHSSKQLEIHRDSFDESAITYSSLIVLSIHICLPPL